MPVSRLGRRRTSWLGTLTACLTLSAGGGEGFAQSIPQRPEQLLTAEVPPFVVPYQAVQQTTLPNGVRLVVLEDPTVPLVDVAIALGVGSALEDPFVGVAASSDHDLVPGLMTTLASMLRRGGGASIGPTELDHASESRGVSIRSFGGRHRSGVLGSAPAAEFDRLAEWMTEVLVRPAFDAAVLDSVRERSRAGLAARYQDAYSLAEREWNALVLGRDHPRIRPLRTADVALWTQPTLRQAHRRFYRPDKTVIAVAGGISTEQAVARFAALLQEWSPPTDTQGAASRTPPRAAPALPSPSKPGFYQVVHGLSQGTLMLGHVGLQRRSWSDQSADAAELLGEILAGPGPVSRLRGRLRDRDGLVYTISGTVGVGAREAGLVQIAWQVDPDNAIESLRAVLEEVRRLREQPPPSRELEVARTALVDALPSLFGTAEQIAGRYAEDLLLDRPHQFWQQYRSRLARVTPEDIQRLARELLRPRDFRAVWVGPRLPESELRQLGFRTVQDLPYLDPVSLAPLVQH